MVPISELSPGVRVKIVDQWNDQCRENNMGLMDRFLGEIVTVLDVEYNRVRIVEDAGSGGYNGDGHWCWNSFCFDCLLEEDGSEEEFEAASVDELLSLICGG